MNFIMVLAYRGFYFVFELKAENIYKYKSSLERVTSKNLLYYGGGIPALSAVRNTED